MILNSKHKKKITKISEIEVKFRFKGEELSGHVFVSIILELSVSMNQFIIFSKRSSGADRFLLLNFSNLYFCVSSCI